MKRDVLGDLTVDLGLAIINLYKELAYQKKEFVLSKQLLRSGTNPGAMVKEAVYAESGKDFIHKLRIAAKEVHETQYWLLLLLRSDYIESGKYEELLSLTTRIRKLLIKSILTKERNLKNRDR